MCEFASMSYEASHESFEEDLGISCEWRKKGARVLRIGLDSWRSWPKSQ